MFSKKQIKTETDSEKLGFVQEQLEHTARLAASINEKNEKDSHDSINLAESNSDNHDENGEDDEFNEYQ